MNRELSLPQPLTRRDFLKTSMAAASAAAIGKLRLPFPERLLRASNFGSHNLESDGGSLGPGFLERNSSATIPDVE